MNTFFTDNAIPVEANIDLGPLTWYGVGGPARWLAHPQNEDQLSKLMHHCHDTTTPVYILGSGANLLVDDQGVDGVVVQLDAAAFKQMAIDGNHVIVGGGYDLRKLVLASAGQGLSGLECMAGIPASVGGAVRMNAGGAYGEIGSSVARVRVMGVDGQATVLDRGQFTFRYRGTNITEPIILDVTFELVPADANVLRERVKEIFEFKKNSQPLAASSAGCSFKNPTDQVDRMPEGIPAAAGALIDAAGLKGARIGGAEVSHHHANFIVTDDTCKASDIRRLMEHVEQGVFEKFGISLAREVVVWP